MSSSIKIATFFLIFNVGCLQKKRTDIYELTTSIKTMWGKELIFDESLSNSDCIGHMNGIYRNISILDGDCSCSVETLERWQEFKNTNE